MPPDLARRALCMLLAGWAAPPATMARVGPAAASVPDDGWIPGLLPWDRAPVDLSFLNAAERPAGRRGFVRVDGERLRHGDGHAARFWGTNLVAHALFRTPREEVPRQARRLSALGYNLVRLHHHDSHWVDPNIFGPADRAGPARIDAHSLDCIDWWVHHLKTEGIHVWLDLHVGRRLRREDGIAHFDEIAGRDGRAWMHGYSYVNASMQRAMQDFNLAWLGHRNPYTGLRYLDEPAVLGLALTNENDITHHFGNALLPDKGVPAHAGLLLAQGRRFAQAHGLPLREVMRTWEPGASRLFLNDLEYRVNRRMLDQLRAAGLRVPAASTNQWGDNPLSSLPALTAGDLIDAHAYAAPGELRRDPTREPTLAHWLAASRVAGRPLVVSEWNMDATLGPDRHTLPLYIAATACHQGWDAVMHYAYAQEALGGEGTADVWHAYNDPALQAVLPAAALLYRQGHVREATTTHVYRPDARTLFGRDVSAGHGPALRVAAERGRLVVALPTAPSLPWLRADAPPSGARSIADPFDALLPPGTHALRSDHGELQRDWAAGEFRIDTPCTQAVMGWIGGRAIRMGEVTIEIDTPLATLAVQSLDGAPIARASHLLLSWTAGALPGPGGVMPYGSEPLRGTLSVAARAGLRARVRDATSGGVSVLDLPYRDGRYHIHLSALPATHWVEMT